MLAILNTAETLTAVMAGAASTTNPTYSAVTGDGLHLVGSLSGTTAVTVVSAPSNGQRGVKSLSIYNGDSASVTITVAKVVGGTSYTLAKIAVAAGYTLRIDETGIKVINDSGSEVRSVVQQILDANGNESIKFGATASAVNELTATNAATANAPELSATGGDTDINLRLTPKGAGFVESNGPFQVRDSVAVTATVGGGTTGLIPAGSTNVVVTSDDANKQISLPAASVGDEIWILVGATGCELISAVAAHKVNDVVVGATNEAALTATNLYWCKYVATNTWVVVGFTKLGAVQAALVPDAL